jgi:long-chain acyl-CoA synthetase
MNLISNTIMCATWVGTKSDAAYLSILPFFHSYGMTTGILAPLYIGAKVVLFPNFDSKQVLQAIHKYQIVVFCGVPTLYEKLLTDPDLGKYSYSSLKYCISGADSLKPELRKRFEKVFSSAVLVEGYGLSEASPITHCHPFESSEEYKVGSIGIPWPDTDVKIVDLEKGENTLKNGELGELVIKGPQIMKGYWNKPEETTAVLRDEWLYTGDLGKMDKDGYFYILDRKKDLIKYKGHSVYPHELEEVLYEHTAVKSCSVIGKPDQIAGEIPKAYVVLKTGATISEQELMKFVNDKVAYYKAIREIEFRTSLPTNVIGKVLKRELRNETNK